MSQDTDLSSLLVRRKPCEILLAVKDSEEAYGRQISEEIDSSNKSYSHTLQVSEKLEEAGLLSRDRDGRKILMQLTRDGEKVAEALENLYAVMQEVGENQ